MPIVAGADHLQKLRPRLERRQPRVRRDESLPIVLHEREEVSFLRGVEVNLAVTQEEDRVDVGEARAAACWFSIGHLRVPRDDVRVGADVGVERTRLVSETFDHRERVRRRIVLRNAVARVGPCEHRFGRPRTATTAASLTATTPRLTGQQSRQQDDTRARDRKPRHRFTVAAASELGSRSAHRSAPKYNC